MKMLLNLTRKCIHQIWSKPATLIPPNIQGQQFTTTNKLYKVEDRKEMLASLPAKDEGTAGEKSIDIDNLFTK